MAAEASLQQEAELTIVDALAQLSFLIHGTLTQHAAKHEVSMIQLRLLGVLRDREPTMQELARLLRLDKSSTTGLIDRAETRGLVRRIRSERDRRSMTVRLTSSARRKINVVEREFRADVERMTADLTPRQRAELARLASRVIAGQ